MLVPPLGYHVTGANVARDTRHWVGGAPRKMWDIGALNRDGGIGSAFAGYSSKNRDGW